jgi:hypothetical protein
MLRFFFFLPPVRHRLSDRLGHLAQSWARVVAVVLFGPIFPCKRRRQQTFLKFQGLSVGPPWVWRFSSTSALIPFCVIVFVCNYFAIIHSTLQPLWARSEQNEQNERPTKR